MAGLPLVEGIKFAVAIAAAVAAATLVATGRREAPNVILAIFLATLAGSYAMDGLGSALREPGMPPPISVFRFQMVFNVLDPIFLLYFAAIYPPRSGFRRPTYLVPLGILAGWLLLAAILDPAQFASTRDAFVRAGSTTGPSHARVAYDLETAGCYVLAFLLLARKRAAAGPLIVGAGAALLPRAVTALMDIFAPNALLVTPEQVVLAAFGRIGLSALLLGVSAFALRGPARPDRPAVLALAGFFAVYEPVMLMLDRLGAWAGGFLLFAAVVFPTRWLVFTALAGYALLERRLPGIDRKARDTVAAAIVAASALAAIGAGVLVADALDAPATYPRASLAVGGVLVGAAAGGAAWPAARRIARRLFPAADDPVVLADRTARLFSTALGEAMAAGRDVLEDPEILRFRRSLGLSEEAHRALAAELTQARTSAVPPVLPGTRIFGRYEILSLLGTGGSGRTWLAKDHATGREVALKHVFGRPNEDGGHRVAAYIREARAVGMITHPNVVHVLDARPAGQDSFLVMEYVAGGSLADRLRRDGPIDARGVVRLLHGVLAGLGAVHAKGVLHRDVKPANILLAEDGTPKLADFGVALVPGLEGAVTRLGSGPQPGTPRYMAPEQVAGLPIDARADVYAVGVVAVEAFTGEPFDAAALARLPCSPPMRAVIARALERRPDDRWQDATAFRRALAAVP